MPVENLGTVTVVLETSLGDITLNLFGGKTPRTVNNFLTLRRRGFTTGSSSTASSRAS